MVERLMSRRAALGALAGSVTVAVVGCGPVTKVVQVILQLPWDKIITVVVSVLTGVVTIQGVLEGREMKTERTITREEVESLEKGQKIKFELKDDKEQNVKPELKE